MAKTGSDREKALDEKFGVPSHVALRNERQTQRLEALAGLLASVEEHGVRPWSGFGMQRVNIQKAIDEQLAKLEAV